MNKKTYDSLDIAKFICALLVVCIHTFPLADISKNANFLLVSVIARAAVPFFFVASAFFFFKKIDFKKDAGHIENLSLLKMYILRLLKVYGIWTLLYLPYSLLLMGHDGFTVTEVLRYVRDFFFTGSYYHLWFLPALIVSTSVLYYAILKFGWKRSGIVALSLYAIGALGNLYPQAISQIPGISNLFSLYTNVFVTTRNGLFFGGVFTLIGAYLATHEIQIPTNQINLLTGISAVLYLVECLVLKMNGLMKDTSSMYFMLVPFIFFLFLRLARVEMKHKPLYPLLRRMSMLIYVSHLLFSQACLWIMPNMHSFMVYAITVGCSFLCSYVIYHISKRFKIVRNLY